MSDCLKKAKEAFSKIVDNDKIQSIHDALEYNKKRALDNGLDMADELAKAAQTLIRDEERWIKAQQLQELISMQAVVDNLLTVKKWQDFGIANPYLAGLLAKIGGSAKRVEGARRSTELRMNHARVEGLTEFHNRLLKQDGALEIWNSKEHQFDIAQSVLDSRAGNKVKNPILKHIGDTVIAMQDRYTAEMRKLGVDIAELKDRIMPNLHDVGQMVKISRDDVKSMKAKNGGRAPTPKEKYNFARDRWKTDTRKHLDIDRMSEQQQRDLREDKNYDDFMNHAYEELVNKDPAGRPSNMANRMAKPRVLHWKDAKSVVDYNTMYGSGSLQDAIMNEIASGMAKVQLTKEWGVSPITTLERTEKLAKLDPSFDRFGKTKDFDKLKRVLGSLTASPSNNHGMVENISRYLRAYQTVTKLGKVVFRSMPDLGLLANEASRAGMNPFEAMGNAIKTVFMDLHPDERHLFKDLLETHMQTEIGSLFKYDGDARPGTHTGNILKISNILNFLPHWDDRIKASTLSMLSQQFAKAKKTTWDKMTGQSKGTFELYDIQAKEWGLIQKSANKVANKKEFITPDSIESVPDDVVRQVLQDHGQRSTKVDVDNFKAETAQKMKEYYMDRVNHVILRPGVIDQHLLTFGSAISLENSAVAAVYKVVTQFKLYSLNYGRVALGSVVYGNGARNFREATIGGKANKTGMLKLAAYMGATRYAGMTLENLVSGQSPPSLSKLDTWGKIIGEGMGPAAMAFDLSAKDFTGSLGRFIAGPTGSDIAKVAKLGYNMVDDTFFNDDYSKTVKSFNRLVSSAIPKYPIFAFPIHNVLLKEWEDWSSPGTRDKYLSDMKERTGSETFY